jgi:hypothetical protein
METPIDPLSSRATAAIGQTTPDDLDWWQSRPRPETAYSLENTMNPIYYPVQISAAKLRSLRYMDDRRLSDEGFDPQSVRAASATMQDHPEALAPVVPLRQVDRQNWKP